MIQNFHIKGDEVGDNAAVVEDAYNSNGAIPKHIHYKYHSLYVYEWLV